MEFGTTGAQSVTFRIAVDSCCSGREIQIRLDGLSGPLIGTLRPTSTGGWTIFNNQVTAVSLTTGLHDVYLVSQGGAGAGNIDWISFSTSPPPPRDPYAGIEGESYDAGQGVCVDAGALACLEPGDWAKYASVDFGAVAAQSVTFRIAVDNCCAGSQIEIRLDSASGTLIGTLVPTATGGWYTFNDQSTSISPTTGLHDVYLVSQGSPGAGNVDRMTFAR
ncbi:MAG: carbohydrate-binding protein [Gemmatimonadota bacterium]